MIQKIQLLEGEGFDPHRNLAVEQYLLEHVPTGCCILYLWQNQRTVVIGRNQNAWRECRTALLEQEGGHLARRLSGGGAVFHDLGNLNFTFLLPDEDYDVSRQLSVICRACQDLGIPAQVTGRNDVTAEGRKFSGNAFYHHAGKAYHHGTLLINVDMERMNRYLSPSKAKLSAKGVASVRSRVVNLREYVPDLDCNTMRQQMAAAFQAVYGLPLERLSPDSLDSAVIDALHQRNAGWEWLYGPKLPFTFECEGRFDWGELQLQFNVERGIIEQAKVWTDSMDWELSAVLEQALTGCRLSADDLAAKLDPVLSGGDVHKLVNLILS